MSGQEVQGGEKAGGNQAKNQEKPSNTAKQKPRNADQRSDYNQGNRPDGNERRPRNDEQRRPGRREDGYGTDYDRRQDPREYNDSRRQEHRRNDYHDQERGPFRSRDRLDQYDERENWNRSMFDGDVPRRQPSRYRDSIRSDSGYYDDRPNGFRYGDPAYHLDDSDYHRPLSYDRRGARPLYRARSLPQKDFLFDDSDFYPLRNDYPGSPPVRRPYSNLGDYGYEQGINSYMGMDSKRDRYELFEIRAKCNITNFLFRFRSQNYIRPTSAQSDYSFPELYQNNKVKCYHILTDFINRSIF